MWTVRVLNQPFENAAFCNSFSEESILKLSDCLGDYLLYLKHEQGVTLTTYKSYYASLNAFLRFLTDNGYPEPSLADLTTPALRRYLHSLGERGLRPRTIHGLMGAVRSFCTFLVSHQLLTENPALPIRLPIKDAAIRQEASEDEIALLLQATKRQRIPKRAAFQNAVICVLVYTGLRRAECCALDVADVNLSEGWLLVKSGKGRKSRKVPLCAEVKDALAEWLTFRPANTTIPALFPADIRRRIHFEGMRHLVDDVKYRAGLGDAKHLTPHSLRHACATRLMHNGASLHDVMTWLGHSQLSTTQRYLHTSEQRLMSIANLAVPRLPKTQQDSEPIKPDKKSNQQRIRRSLR